MEVGSCHRLRYRHTNRHTDIYLEILDIRKSVAVTDSGTDRPTDTLRYWTYGSRYLSQTQVQTHR